MIKGSRLAPNWELIPIVYFVVALSAATDTAGFLRFAPSLGLPSWAAVLCVIPVKLIEWKFLTFAVQLWSRSGLGKLQAPVYFIVWTIAVSLSALAAHSSIYTILAAADRGSSKSVETRANLVVALGRVSGRLDAFPKPLPRPTKTVEVELRWPALQRPSLDCAQLPDAGSRPCKKLAELSKELTTASEYERLTHEEQELREKLAGLTIEAANDPMPHAFEATIGQLIKVDGKNGIALMVTLVLGLVSAFGPFGLDTLREGQASPPRPGAPREGEPALDAAQGRCPEGARSQYPSAPLTPGTSPGSPSGNACKPAQDPTGNDLGQASQPAQRPALGAANERAQEPSNVVQFAPHAAHGRVDHIAAAAAVRTFVGMLERSKHARAMGSELARAYGVQRLAHGWPDLPGNILGIHLKTAVEELGGRKFKSGAQVYEGVRIPPAWLATLGQAA